MSMGHTSEKPPQKFMFYYRENRDEPRIWSRRDEQTWEELYPDGVKTFFRVTGRSKIGPQQGTVVVRIPDEKMEVFIPDLSEDRLVLYFRPITPWRAFAKVEEVE